MGNNRQAVPPMGGGAPSISGWPSSPNSFQGQSPWFQQAAASGFGHTQDMPGFTPAPVDHNWTAANSQAPGNDFTPWSQPLLPAAGTGWKAPDEPPASAGPAPGSGWQGADQPANYVPYGTPDGSNWANERARTWMTQSQPRDAGAFGMNVPAAGWWGSYAPGGQASPAGPAPGTGWQTPGQSPVGTPGGTPNAGGSLLANALRNYGGPNG